MKRILFIACVFFVLTTRAQSRMTIDQVSRQWTSRNIMGIQKGSGTIQLVEAFNRTYPTYSVTEFLKDAQRPADQQQWLITVDRPNGYISFAEGSDDASSESMQACVWRRSNGHRLLAIAFVQQSSQAKAFTAFFDLDPATGTLTPEKSLSRLFVPNKPAGIVSITLPQHGKDMVVTEYYINAMLAIRHIFAWDGMKPSRERVEIENIDKMWSEYLDQAMMEGEHPVTQYALIDIDGDNSPELMLRSDSKDYVGVFALYDGQHELIAGQDYKRHLNFYHRAVGSSGGCGTGCIFTDWTLLENSRPKHHIEDVQEYNPETDKMVDNYSLDGREIVHAKEAESLIKSFGMPINVTPQWKPLNK